LRSCFCRPLGSAEEAVDALESYSWPGNVRELKNLVERAVYRSGSSLITDIEFDPFRSPYGDLPAVEVEVPAPEAMRPHVDDLMERPLKDAVKELKIRMVRKALKDKRYNQRAAADSLGLTYHQFRGLFRKYREEIE